MRRANWTVLAAMLATAWPAGAAQFVIERPTNLGHPRSEGLIPAVHARIGGVEGLFVLDTGANASMLSRSFAARIGAVRSGVDIGSDSGGQLLRVSLLAKVPVVLGDVSQTLAKVAVADIAPLEVMGFSGVISPHSLAGDGCTVMDFAHGEGWVAKAGDPLCASPKSAIPLSVTPKRLPTIVVTDGESGREAVFIVDSGANRSSLADGFGAAAPLVRTGQDQGLAGITLATRVVGPVCLRVGGYAAVLAEATQFSPGRPAVLSFEVLKDARVVMRADGTGFLTLPQVEQGCLAKS